MLCKHWFASSVWNFCRRVADVPPRETSPAAKSEEKRMFLQAIVQYIYKVNNFLECCLIPLIYYCFCFFGPHRDTKMCRELVGQHGVKILNTFDSHGHTPLHWAALGGYSELIKFFLNCGVDVNRQSRSDYGPYPIHWACVNGHILCVDLLIQNGASIDCTDNKGCTPLIISAQYGKAMLAGYLIGKGAKSFFTDHEGDNALHWACFKGEHFSTFLATEWILACATDKS